MTSAGVLFNQCEVTHTTLWALFNLLNFRYCFYYFLKGKDNKSTEATDEMTGPLTQLAFRGSEDSEGCVWEEDPT